MDDSGFPRTPDRPVKLLGTCVRYLRSVETSIGARGPDFLGGSATVWAHLGNIQGSLGSTTGLGIQCQGLASMGIDLQGRSIDFMN